MHRQCKQVLAAYTALQPHSHLPRSTYKSCGRSDWASLLVVLRSLHTGEGHLLGTTDVSLTWRIAIAEDCPKILLEDESSTR